MTGALAFLMFQSWKNRTTMRLKRLNQPKYLVGALVGGAYMYFYFGRFIFGGNRGTWNIDADNVALWEAGGAMILGCVIILAWIIPSKRAALVFSEAEIAFLFPAPVHRVTLIHWKLLKSQIGILFTTVLFTILFRRANSASSVWIRALGWWIIFSSLNLHFLASSFAMTRLLQRGVTVWKRRAALLVLLGLAVGGVIYWGYKTVPAPDFEHYVRTSDLKYYFQQLTAAGPLPWLLYPFRLIVRPYLSLDAASFLAALWPALLIMAVHYLWVVRADVAFEEASIDASKRVADRIAQVRAAGGRLPTQPKRRKRPPFRLNPTGSPAIALLWKNLIGASNAFSPRLWFLFVWIAIVSAFATSHGPGHGFNLELFVSVLSLTFLAVSFIVGPQFIRQDFRQDLVMADLLKSYPLPGWQVALGELLGPAVVLTGLQWLLIILATSFSTNIGRAAVPLELRYAAAGALAIIAPGLNFVCLLTPNAAVLLFPGWFQIGRGSPQGVEVMGQRLLMGLAQMLVFLVTLLPAAGVAFVVIYLGQWFLSPSTGILLAAVLAAAVLAVESWLGLLWLGRLFERLDISTDSSL